LSLGAGERTQKEGDTMDTNLLLLIVVLVLLFGGGGYYWRRGR
jgi:LPXTG-motif cell wall-anchored protein